MKSRIAVLALAVLLAIRIGAIAAPPDVPDSLTVQPGQLVQITVKVPIDKDGKPIGEVFHFTNFGKTDAFWGEMVSQVPGERNFVYQAPLKAPNTAIRGENGRSVKHVVAFATVGEKTGKMTTINVEYPDPTPVVPPTPPQPKPVDPTPSADAPIPAPGLHVLVVYDAPKLSTLSVDQQGAIFSQTVRDYLRATCPKGPDGTTAEWRMWPADVDATGESALWQAAMKRPRASLPWVIVSNGTTGFEGPLPGNATDMLALLKKYGGK